MNWEAFDAIFQAIGAIATAAAVIVALWQTKYGNKKRLKLSFSINGCIYGEDGVKLRFVMVSVSNIGNRAVVLRNWGIILSKKNNLMVVADPTDKMLNVVNTILPRQIHPEESVDLALRLNNLNQCLNKAISKNPKDKKKRVRVFIVDSTGKVYKKRTKFTAGELLTLVRKIGNSPQS